MFNSLDASVFNTSNAFYESQFEVILTKIVDCYKYMLADNVTIPNDENKIRDILLINYLKNDAIRDKVGLTDYHFEREVLEDFTVGRTDLKIISCNTFVQQAAYYILECKRIDNSNALGSTGLNAKYIENGILRFTSEFYSSFYRVNGLVGFIVEAIDIAANIESINKILSTLNNIATLSKISKISFEEGYEHHYRSLHLDISKRELSLHHLMLDFSKNMQ